MDLIHSMIFLPFVLSELESKPLPLRNTVFPAWLAAPSPTFQLRFKDWVWLPCTLKSHPWYQPGIVTIKGWYCFYLLSAKRLNSMSVSWELCAACSVCFSLLLPRAGLHWTVWYSRQHNTENNTGTYLSCQCLLMHFWMVLAGSVCYLFVQWLKEEQCCCCLHESSRDPAC